MPSLSDATVAPARRVQGRLHVPGDKSISHRYALLAALAVGRSELRGFSRGADCHSTLACLRGLGLVVEAHGDIVTIDGRGLGGFIPPATDLDAGNSGTTMRMLCGVLAAQRFDSRMVGDESLSRRPMRRVIEPIAQMGGRIDATDGHAPLIVHGTRLHAIAFHPTVPSAQVKSAVMLAGLHTEGATSVTEPAQTRDHTERAFAAFGFPVTVDGRTITVEGGHAGAAQSLLVPGDFSSAAFWMVAATILPGSHVVIEDVGLNPTRTALIGVLQRFGAHVEVEPTGHGAGEPIGTITVSADRANAVAIAPDEVPALIDELPAVAALAAGGADISVSGAEELRVKESDRIRVLVEGFRALGLEADECPDGFLMHGSRGHQGGHAHAEGDHRMAMAFAVAALAGRGPSRIEGADSVAISYPGFFDTLHRVVG